MIVKLDKRLNFVVPVLDANDNPIAYVHSAPIDRTVFETYFLVVSKTFSAIYGEGLGSVGGPRVAALILKRVAQDMNMWDGPEGVQSGLVNEIRRLTNVIMPGEDGWQTIPFEDAIRQNRIDADDAAEVENAITFFIVSSAMHRRNVLMTILDGAAKLWGALTTLSNCTEFAASLPTSKEAANFGVTAQTSQVPY